MKKVIKYTLFALGAFLALMIAGVIVEIPKADKEIAQQEKTEQDSLARVYNIDTLIARIKNDTTYKVKDVYYNKVDSSLSIAYIYNKETDVAYPNAFDDVYHLSDYKQVDGVTQYAYVQGKSLAKGDYKEYLAANSHRWGRKMAEFKDKFFTPYGRWMPVKEYLEKNIDDPGSLEIEGSFDPELNNNGTYRIKTLFRARNSFGALMKHAIYTDIDSAGHVLDAQVDI
jgi:hypothetical protein